MIKYEYRLKKVITLDINYNIVEEHGIQLNWVMIVVIQNNLPRGVTTPLNIIMLVISAMYFVI